MAAAKSHSDSAVADSWEDDLLEEAEESSNVHIDGSKHSHKDNEQASQLSGKEPPRPKGSPKASKVIAPMSPSGPPSPPPNTRATNSPAAPSSMRTGRPETVGGPAARMIASALGVKPAPRTAEQRMYDRAVKEKEIRRKNDEKERIRKTAEEREKMQKEMWQD